MKTSVYNKLGEDTGRKIELNDLIFAIEPNDHAIYLDCKQYMANKRQGTHATLHRGLVSGSTRKIKRQKGTGTARAGSIKNPLFRGGGTTFGPEPRLYHIKLNKKLKKLARKSALSYRAKENKIFVVDNLLFDEIKTKNIINLKNNFKINDKKITLVVAESNKSVYLSSRNLKDVNVVTASDLSTYDIMWASVLVMEEKSIDVFENNLA
ncbi:MAG: 50S ribosomal protein L4 [Bacteroidota bacterium]|jgi:large subunit ribosomal protein L4|nr:50S ribosomal protein L4 [Bacteroidales bacterium]MDI9535543.1 50S ribosomal protein L4 [Bacteroidota bacterium]NLP20329.1 50S ribosomal protein L4 [Bacteroidales bacterium]HNY43440.1 50S ribosomal protein L4 [Bacteroidales bacterium]HOD88785.1 50S ribosomal protein L4 [Bacteroidales bacterium]